ncbi:carbohydrate kinase YjeF-like protein [Candidatus Omnitrophus magneticus]|uniref:ADP-dependent (S)-NAD(P)H-hydrate dehydratase n=1 Tax=Candidatus Omnitrophus magneticus TaxID=1609969 RepID=A0A0F0CJE4_9BACT|nr:carbohydrate kinase YjeF-like protein [Candidatus Omnitrophus magneticus]
MVTSHIEKISVRQDESHKGDYGKVLVVAGSIGMTGAAYLASQAALRAGSGLVTNAVPCSLNPIMAIKFIEVMTLALSENKNGTLNKKSVKEILEFSKKCDVSIVGPGMGRAKETRAVIIDLIRYLSTPLVLDADGLNAIEGKLSLFKKRKYKTVITPHPGEMARLIKKDVTFVQEHRTEIAKEIAETTGIVVCLKGHKTVVASPDGELYVNDTGNSGMATGGTGDVLAGIIASFIGQGIDIYSAVVVGVYLHGISGDIAAEKHGPFSMIAGDVIQALPDAFKKAGLY